MNIKILPEVYDKIMYWVDKCPKEISGLGKVTFDENGMTVVSAYLLNQENTSASTDIDAEDVGRLEYETKDYEGHLNFWWHSHVNMDVFWSGTDTDTIEEFGKNGWCLAGVFNKKKETRFAYFQNATKFLPKIFSDDLGVEIERPVTESPDWDKEYDDKVKVKEITYVPPYQGAMESHNRQYYEQKECWGIDSKEHPNLLTISWFDFDKEGYIDEDLEWCSLYSAYKIWDTSIKNWRYCE